MKRILAISALVFLNLICCGASPQEEDTFLTVVREAYVTKNKEAIIALICWDRVTEKHRAIVPKALDYSLSRTIKSMEYRPVDSTESHSYTKDGITYGPNLPVMKRIEIVYEDAPGQAKLTSSLYVGEKDGKLMIVNLAPVQ